MKKLISILLAVSLTASFTFCAAAETAKFGDTDGDGKITAADALNTLQCSVGKLKMSDAQRFTADVDGDTLITSSDALSILQYSVGKITCFSDINLAYINAHTAESDKLVIVKDGKSDFTIAVSEKASAIYLDAAKYLKNAILEKTGAELEITSVLENDEYDRNSHQIVIGETYCDESVKACENVVNSQYSVVASQNKVAISGGSIVMIYEGIAKFIDGCYDGEKGLSIALNAEVTCETGTKSTAAYTGDEYTENRNDSRTGGPQFVTKLFTEGLGRAPEGSEYLEFMNIIKEKDCTPETLSELARKIFSSDEFKGLNLTDVEAAFAVYRAVLNRDPSENEIKLFKIENLIEVVNEFIMSDEFKYVLLPEILIGSYGWSENNMDIYSGSNVYTDADVNAMLAKNDVVSLPQGSLVLCSSEIVIPEGKTLETEGTPDRYFKMARIMRAVPEGDFALVHLTENSTARSLFVDGNRTEVGKGNGPNVWVAGGHTKVINNKMCDTAGPSNMPTVCGYTGIYIGYNLITCYTSGHQENWTDGITHQARGIIEYNAIIDATDVGIVVFRQWQPGWTQDSIIRYNKIINVGNPVFGMLHTDAWYGESSEKDFTGCVFLGNELWTSMKAQATLCLSASSVAWFNTGDLAKGTVFMNNYTPKGLSVMTSIGLVADGTTDVVMRGNQLKLYIGDWGNGAFGGHHIIAFNNSQFTGDVQKPFENVLVHDAVNSYIAGRQNEGWSKIKLTPAEIYEDFVPVPESYTAAN